MKFVKHLLILTIPFIMFSCSKEQKTKKNNPDDPQLSGWRVQEQYNIAGNGYINIAALQNDGRLIIATDKEISRINADGTKDNSFVPHTDIAYIATYCTSLTPLSDGKILVGFSLPESHANVGYRALYRLNSDGSIDNSFIVDLRGGHQSRTTVKAAIPLGDGSVIVAGNFYKADGVQKYHLAKLTATGRDISDFDPKIVPETLNSFDNLYSLPGNRFMVTGPGYTNLLLAPFRQYAIIFNNAGSVDESFNFTEEMYVEFPAPRVKTIHAVEQLHDGSFLFVGSLDNIWHINAGGQLSGSTAFSNQVNAIVSLDNGKFLLGSSYSGGGIFDVEYKEFLSVYDKNSGSLEHTSLGFEDGGVRQIFKIADNSYFIIGDFYKGAERYHILKVTR